ncbi:aminoglycoside phosphotransferase family protein [Glycomyces sp. A-F 0318]|uniref:phosphotransferase n=1 Tax=Glycomyces amatae TaxID=2881355 RepID=UPI001E3CAB43|nr:aminoglycoside phosphotransferase family protein [Glycomyces amatae]MCD0443051.1 aminoglycoside phosphotransferase family protein [Glycomyces amatae]
MKPSDLRRAVAAAVSTAAELGLSADDAAVLHDSNRIAVRLLPCDVLARVAHVEHRAGAEFEVEVARRLAETDAPVAGLAPRVEPGVHVRDGFAITLWQYCEPLPSQDIAPAEYARSLARLHEGMRRIDVPAPHFTDRVAQARRLVDAPALTPDLGEADRRLLGGTLADLSRAIADSGAEMQLLHGEPHPGNLLETGGGPLFIDLETCCRGPVEFDIAHAPEEVGGHYPGADPDLLRQCRILTLAIATSWRWDPDDQLPNGRRLAAQWLDQIRAMLDQGGDPHR